MTPTVRAARADELDTASAVLTDAFIDEAGLNYWLRQDAKKKELIAEIIAHFSL